MDTVPSPARELRVLQYRRLPVVSLHGGPRGSTSVELYPVSAPASGPALTWPSRPQPGRR